MRVTFCELVFNSLNGWYCGWGREAQAAELSHRPATSTISWKQPATLLVHEHIKFLYILMCSPIGHRALDVPKVAGTLDTVKTFQSNWCWLPVESPTGVDCSCRHWLVFQFTYPEPVVFEAVQVQAGWGSQTQEGRWWVLQGRPQLTSQPTKLCSIIICLIDTVILAHWECAPFCLNHFFLILTCGTPFFFFSFFSSCIPLVFLIWNSAPSSVVTCSWPFTILTKNPLLCTLSI